MDLFIETLTGTAFELRVSPNDTVMSIKSKIQRVEGIPVAQQHLIWQNDELSDNQLLRDCNIPGGATLRLVLGMRGGPINTCRPPPIATAAAIRFTPTVRFATSNNPASATGGNLKKNRRDDALKNARLSASTASLQDLKEVIDSDSGEKKDLESEKRITFFIFNSRDSLDLLRVLDSSPRSGNNRLVAGPASSSGNGTSTTSLLGPDDSSSDAHAYKVTHNPQTNLTSNLLSASTAAQSLPYLQTEPSGALSCEQLPQLASTNSEPSVPQATSETKSSSSPVKTLAATSPTSSAAATAILAGLLYAARGGDTAYSDDTDECASSDCGASGYTTTAAAYWLRPPSSNEWDYRESLSPPSAHPLPPAPALEEFPFVFGDEEEEDVEDTGLDDDDDSLADLEDYFLYYRSGDVLFGPPTSSRRGLTTLSLGDRDALAACKASISPRKARERDDLAEKVRSIKVQLCQAREERLHRRQQKQQNHVQQATGDEATVWSKKMKQADLPSFGAAACPPTEIYSGHLSPCYHHLPKIRTPWHANIPSTTVAKSKLPQQHLSLPPYRRTHFRRPYTTSSVDLSGATSAVTTPFSTAAVDTPSSLLLLPSRRFSNPRSPAVSSKTTLSAINGDTVLEIPPKQADADGSIGYCNQSPLGSVFNLRQRRFGTVQAPNISQIGDITDIKLPNLSLIPSSISTTLNSSLLGPPFKPAAFSTTDRPSTATDRHLYRSATARLFGGPDANAEVIRGRSLTTRRGSNKGEVVVPLPPIIASRGGTNTSFSGDVSDLHRQPSRSKGEEDLGIATATGHSNSASHATPTKHRPDMSEPPRRSPKPNKTNRCASCNRKTGLANSYTCRCERNFCSRHRYAEMHACSFDYKADARRFIRESNPVITATKLPKI